MSVLTILLTCAALLLSGATGTNLGVPLQTLSVILFGFAALCATPSILKLDGLGGGESTDKKTRYSWLLGWILVSISYFVIRACYSPVWDLGIEDLMLILPAAILYLIAGYAMRGGAGVALRQGLAGMVILLLLLHIGACFMQLQGDEGASLARYFSGAAGRDPQYVSGMYAYHGSFANFAVIAGLLCLSLGIWGRVAYGLRVLIFLIGLVGLGLAIWAQSRSATLSLCLALGVFIILLLISMAKQRAALKKRMRIVISSVGLVGFVGLALGALWVFSQRGANSVAMIFENAGVRIPLWAMAAEQWSDRPWVGAGSRSYSYECYHYWAPGIRYAEKDPVFVHNEYLQLLTDYGLIGLLLILSAFVLHGKIGAQSVARLSEQVGGQGLKKGSNAMALAIAGMSGMTAMAVHICFDFRTHVLANLLLLICCAVWILPLSRSRGNGGSPAADSGGKQNKKNWAMALILFVLGLGAIGLGGQQLWAKLPLLEQRMGKEYGAGESQEVDREVWIPMLEKSLSRAPQWRRYQRLGTLYRLKAADTKSPEKKRRILVMAEDAYRASVKRHAFNPIARINLAAVYAEQQRREEADEMYASASDRAKVREPWFGMHNQWAELHHAMALLKLQAGKEEEVRFHFARAKELFEISKEFGASSSFGWSQKYARCMVDYANFLDDESSYLEAEKLYQLAEKTERRPSFQQQTRVNFYHARHYYRHGRALWKKRQPEAAYQMMLQAQGCMLADKKYTSEQNEDAWEKQMEQIQEVIRFFKLTGIAK